MATDGQPAVAALDRPGRWADWTDSDLLRACGAGERAALRELYDRHGCSVLAAATVVARRTGAEAEALVVRAFTALWWETPRVLAGRHTVLRELLHLVARTTEEVPLAA